MKHRRLETSQTNFFNALRILLFVIFILTGSSYAQDSLNVRWINGYFGVMAYQVKCSEINNNKYAFVSLRGSIIILNVNDPAHPQKVKEFGHPGEVGGIGISDTILFIACGHYGLWIYNVANPTNPIRITTYKDTRAYRVAISGNYAYVADAESGLVIIDISQLSSPVKISTFYTGSCGASDVIVSDTIAYIASRKLWIINVANPYNPSLISIWNPHAGLEAVQQIDKEGNFLYVTEMGIPVSGFWIIDVSNPQNPVSADSIRIAWARCIDADGTYAYCIGDEVFMVLDITNPYDVNIIATRNFDGSGLFSYGNYVYIAAWKITLIIDVNDHTNPYIIGSHNHFRPMDVVISGNYAYLCMAEGGLWILDISDPLNPFEIGSYGPLGFTFSLSLFGDYVCVVERDSVIRIINISNPHSPYEVGHLTLFNYMLEKVITDGNYAYIAAGVRGLVIIDISNPSSPFFVSSLLPSGSYINATNIVKYRNYIYLLCAAGGVRIIDVSNPYSPFEIGRFKGGCSGGIGFNSNYALVAGCGPIYSVDIDDPSSPVPVDSLSTQLSVIDGDVEMMGSYGVVSGSGIPLYVINFVDPFNIILAGYYEWYRRELAFPPWIHIAIKDHYIFITTDSGLQIFQFYGLSEISESKDMPKIKRGFDFEPNPFSETVKITWQIPADKNLKDQTAKILIYDITGRVVKTFSISEVNRNLHSITWDGLDDSNRRLPSGIYFSHLLINNYSMTGKIILLK